MANEPEENEGSGETEVKPTITIAEKTGSGKESAEKDTITIAEKNPPKNP